LTQRLIQPETARSARYRGQYRHRIKLAGITDLPGLFALDRVDLAESGVKMKFQGDNVALKTQQRREGKKL
jgi:hypothetical protein